MLISFPDNSRPEKATVSPFALVIDPAPRTAFISGIVLALRPNEYVCSSAEFGSKPFHSLPPIYNF